MSWVALVTAGLCLLAAPVQAWNESGHRIIAAAAARQMPVELREQISAALRAHPRYQQDLLAFKPKRLAGLTEFEWLLGQAAQWPDHARSFDNAKSSKQEVLVERFHRGRWHYINLPVYLTPADGKKLRIKDPTLDVNAKAPGDVLEALAFMRAALRDSDTSLADKGLWVSWALHLIADVHQPLHTSALFVRKRWPRGDRGGNEVKIAGSGRNGRLDSLHWFWDSAISNRREPGEVRELAGQIHGMLVKRQVQALVSDEAQPVMWIREGKGVAERLVYEPLRAQLNKSPVVKVSKRYTQQAHATALRRSALASRRTALWLAESFGG